MRTTSLLGAGAVLACSGSLVAQGDVGRRLLERLPVLEGRVTTYYAGVSSAQAAQTQTLIQDATETYAATTGASLVVELALVGADEWRILHQHQSQPQPYTHFITSVRPGPPFIIWIPTGRGHALDNLVQPLARDSGMADALGLRPDQIADRFTRLLALHEIGHFYARGAFPNLTTDPAAWWLGEFAASYLTTAFLAAHRHEDARLWQAVCAAAVKHLRPQSAISGDLHAGQMADNYLVYLGRLQQRIDDVRRKHGDSFVSSVRAGWTEHDPAAASVRAMQIVERASPGFTAWVGAHHRGS